MEAVSRGAKESGGKTFGVTAQFFQRSANPWIDTEIRVNSWQERLFELIRLADGYVTCKGGTGTLVLYVMPRRYCWIAIAASYGFPASPMTRRASRRRSGARRRR